MRQYAWAWPVERFRSDPEYLIKCLYLARPDGAIMWPNTWQHMGRVQGAGLETAAYLPTGKTIRKDWWDHLIYADRIILGDEPRIREMDANLYLDWAATTAKAIAAEGFEHVPLQLAGMSMDSNFLGKYRPSISNYAQTVWHDMLNVNWPGRREPGFTLNAFWQSPFQTARQLGSANGGRFNLNVGFENYPWWREPISSFYRDVLGWEWQTDDPYDEIDVLGIWCLHTHPHPKGQDPHQWGLVRQDENGFARLTRSGRRYRRYRDSA